MNGKLGREEKYETERSSCDGNSFNIFHVEWISTHVMHEEMEFAFHLCVEN